jgi:3',5'-cyclic AMP phosphodiesterase CpdA
MSFSIVHVSDLHFGDDPDLRKIASVENLVPDLEPDVIVISGDSTLRARHGEYQAARMFTIELERTAPVYVIPGDHDVQWWWRPLIPFAPAVKYAKFREYFGPALTPTLDLTEGIVAGALTSHGINWRSLTPHLRGVAVKGYLSRQEMRRVAGVFDRARPEQARVLVMHHNVLQGEVSQRMGLVRWRGAHRRIVESGVDVVLCGHDHEHQIDVLDGVVISCAGAISARSQAGQQSAFHRVCIDDDAIQVELYVWAPQIRSFKRTDMSVFTRRRSVSGAPVAAGTV